MSELETIQAALQAAARRRRWARGLRGLWTGLLAGAILTALLAGAYRVFPLPLWTLVVAGVAPFPCMLAGFLSGWWRCPAIPETARWVDTKEHLKERLSTALEVAAGPETPWRGLVLADAATHARDLAPERLQPFHLSKAARWSLAVLALGAGLGFVPEYRSKAHLNRQADAQNIQEAGKQLADLTRRNLEKRQPVLENTQKAIESVAELGDQLAKATPSRTEALRELSNAAERLKDELKEFARDPALRKLDQSAQSGGGKDAAGLQKSIDALQKQLGNQTANADTLEKLQRQLEKLGTAAKALADSKGAEADAQRQKLAAELSSVSKQLQDMGINLPELDQAIEALAASQTDTFLKDLQAATQDLEKMREMAKSLQQMQQQMEQLGKDLGEQLDKGQAEAALATLNKMIEQLNSANLSQEQLDQMQQEVSQATNPAAPYGNVAEHLKNAAGKMKSGDKAQAAQELAAAAKELEQLAQQLGDMQALKAELDALGQASMCIGTGKGWAVCQRPSSGQGGKPGAGVGTWADEGQGWDGQQAGGWDNSGVTRPDMAPRGVTDREQTDLADALKPTKVKGQFSPGSQMPSVTLKGVSIRGQSTVEYEAAATSAQSDAESALAQEKVPKAYKGAVRDYFDDLKK